MKAAIEDAGRGIRRHDGGPFGACVVKGGRIVAVAHNEVLKTGNPTRHAEIVAIGLASQRLGSHLLEGCDIYSTTEPCPMCFSAIHWARMRCVFFGTSVPDVQRLGFNELTISNRTLKRLGRSPLVIRSGVARAECRKLLLDWKSLPGQQLY
jgi:guanine deaminase